MAFRMCYIRNELLKTYSTGAQLLREVGALVYVVGLANGPLNRNELEVIAGHSSRVYGTSDVSELEEELRTLTRICSRKKKVQA
ncbi:hypothetical protein OESDEN_01183 [Oesophagostomum dentatum]|uniref:VWFA domain-containing protein n=1 Tax=Oesophagostomum dentatum TaxID=61180 RepID=A0A0B1TSL0_OESDE|nr:hypothetical protein OESDEN_01183 [Oesophagostomum dentatum]